MTKRSRTDISVEATRRNLEQLARLGGELHRARLSRDLTQAEVASIARLGRSTISAIERGRGGGHTIDTWQRLALAVERPLRVDLERDRAGQTADAVHLAIQELILRLARASGWPGTFELQVRPDTRHSVDVGLRHDRNRVLVLVECWNTIDDFGAAARSSAWKVRKAEELGVALGGPRAYRAAGCWVVRATARNRALVERYPEAFAARFPGSSWQWVRTLTRGDPPPDAPGLVWCDLAATRIFPWRRRR